MKAVRRYLIPLAILIGLSFCSVLIIEGSHHHENMESHEDCSLCSWQSMGSQAPSAPTPPALPFYVLILPFFFTFTLLRFSRFSLSTPGRSPPAILL